MPRSGETYQKGDLVWVEKPFDPPQGDFATITRTQDLPEHGHYFVRLLSGKHTEAYTWHMDQARVFFTGPVRWTHGLLGPEELL